MWSLSINIALDAPRDNSSRPNAPEPQHTSATTALFIIPSGTNCECINMFNTANLVRSAVGLYSVVMPFIDVAIFLCLCLPDVILILCTNNFLCSHDILVLCKKQHNAEI